MFFSWDPLLLPGGWSWFVAKGDEGWGTEFQICSTNLLWGFEQILFGPASRRHLTETGASI